MLNDICHLKRAPRSSEMRILLLIAVIAVVHGKIIMKGFFIFISI